LLAKRKRNAGWPSFSRFLASKKYREMEMERLEGRRLG
jgi:peptide methionine sulfoxide reductase MsrB